MNKDNVKEYRKLLDWLEEDGVIQVKDQFGKWNDIPNPMLAIAPSEYRRKPWEPKFKVGDRIRSAWSGLSGEICEILTEERAYSVLGIRGCVLESDAESAKKTKKRVPLGPEDVPPLSIIRRKDDPEWHWRLLNYVHGVGCRCADRGYSWEEILSDYEIKRPGEGWLPCWKEVEE